jgi:hypothetical protein
MVENDLAAYLFPVPAQSGTRIGTLRDTLATQDALRLFLCRALSYAKLWWAEQGHRQVRWFQCSR